MAYDPQDDGFHEIQLSGKQLVFLFMATTVVSIVIFLCGVLVGRGVPSDAEARGVAAEDEQRAELGSTGDAAGGQGGLAADASVPSPAETQPTSETDLTYPDRLAEAQPPTEQLPPSGQAQSAAPEDLAGRDRPESESASETAASDLPGSEPADSTPDNAPTPPEPEASAETPSPSTPSTLADAAAAKSAESRARREAESAATSEGETPAAEEATPDSKASGKWTVQVAALSKRDEAESIAKRLQGKGYVAFIVGPRSGASSPMYRVRVGSYGDRAEAERVMRQLSQEEKLKPWITR
ncbi:MAG: hypothetical protein GEU99_01955 [Luteitalea sp.]|nr:hypothetical protein [Luteitalea sp.]